MGRKSRAKRKYYVVTSVEDMPKALLGHIGRSVKCPDKGWNKHAFGPAVAFEDKIMEEVNRETLGDKEWMVRWFIDPLHTQLFYHREVTLLPKGFKVTDASRKYFRKLYGKKE
jgi:hypothetical protein